MSTTAVAPVVSGSCINCGTPWELSPSTHTVTFHPGRNAWTSSSVAQIEGGHEWTCPTFVNPVVVGPAGTLVASVCGLTEHVEDASA